MPSANDTIGIIGAGHLGRSLAESLISTGFPRDRLRLSHAGSPATLDAIREAGLENNLTTNEDLCRHSSVIFIAIRPQSVALLDVLPFPRDALVVSCMAGIPRSLLQRRWGINVIRMMTGGPDTIIRGKGIAGIVPASEVLTGILTRMGMRVRVLPDEEAMQVFTAGVCFTAAILACRARGRNPDHEVSDAVCRYPLLAGMYAWAQEAQPAALSDAGRDEYIAKMSTPGGITEAIVRSIRKGDSLSDAMQAGIDRGRAISRDAEATLSD